MQVIGSHFTKKGQVGDFEWMLDQSSDYEDALFIFNDNEQQFLAHRKDPEAEYGCVQGGGNAVIRPYQCQDPPRAIGIPTGLLGAANGYQNLEDQTSAGETVQALIDEALHTIRDVAQKYDYQQIIYSVDSNGDLATSIFNVGPEVKKYIAEKLRAMASST